MTLRILIALVIVGATTIVTHATPLLNETFSYPDGDLTTVSGGNWTAHSGEGNKPIQVSGGTLVLQQSTGSGEDVNRVIGVTQGVGETWYAGFDLTVTGGDGETYFAHFKTDGTFFMARAWITSSGSGDFTLGLSSGSSIETNLATGLTFGVTYRVIVSYDFDTGENKLWLDPSSEASPSISDSGFAGDATTQFAFRQASPTPASTQVIDNLLVGTTFADVLGGSTTPEAPAITTDPVSQTVAEGYPALFSGAASGTPTPTYQWYKDPGNIPLNDETNTSLLITSAAFADAGDYKLVAENSEGSATSTVATLTVIAPQIPVITVDPSSLTIPVSQTVTLSGAANGIPTPTYQWLKDGIEIPGETSTNFSIASVVHTNAGGYQLVASSPAGSVTSAVATLTVVGFAIPIQNTNTFQGTPVNVPIPFFDNQSPITSVTAVSGNQGLLPNGNIVPSGSGSDWSLSLSPLPGTNGVAIITVTASDGSFTTNATFGLIVVPSSGVFFNDYFDYADGTLVTVASNVWVAHSSGTEPEVFSGLLFISQAGGQDVNATLIGAPYAPDSGSVLYSKFTLNCLTLSEDFDGNYVAHFKDDGFSYRARVFTSTNGAASGKFRLGIGNNNGNNTNLIAYLASDLSPGVEYTVVTRFDSATGQAALWVNPSVESDPSVTDTNTLNPVDLTSYAFRQSSFMGEYLIDGLVVGGSFESVMTGAPIPIPLNIERSGGDVVLTWSGPGFTLQAAPAVTGTYTNVPEATSPYTNAISGEGTFFRLINNQ